MCVCVLDHVFISTSMMGFTIVLGLCCDIFLFLSYICSNNVNTNHPISGGKLW